MKCSVAALGLLLASTALAATAAGEDYFLTIGGGYAPTGNQVSLEKNVRLFREFVREEYPGGATQDIFFSDGSDPARDVQFAAPQDSVPRANRLLAQVFRQEKYLEFAYRTSDVPDVRGATTRENLSKWFDEHAPKLHAGDRLFIYATAHGGSSGDKKQPSNTKLYLWNRKYVQVSDLVKHLDKLNPDVAVVAVMVQCYSGGFANIVFNEAEPKKGLAAANRCGFFATVESRPAAGCTADINEENYREYSSYFFEAIRGKTRSGESIELPDYDGDREVSFAEAHAYALLASSTIDISVCTSDAFLRAQSKLKSKDHADLLSADAPYDELLALASPEQHVVLEELSAQLDLHSGQRAKAARDLAGKISGEKKKIDGELRKQTGELNKAASAIRETLINRWPEIANRWHPQVSELLAGDGDAVVKLIESHPSYKKFEELRERTDELSTKKLELDRKWAKCQRLIRSLENVALAANLPRVADSDVQRRYGRLLAAEHGKFGEKAAAHAAAAD